MRENVPGSVGGFAGAEGRTTFGPLQPWSSINTKQGIQIKLRRKAMGEL